MHLITIRNLSHVSYSPLERKGVNCRREYGQSLMLALPCRDINTIRHDAWYIRSSFISLGNCERNLKSLSVNVAASRRACDVRRVNTSSASRSTSAIEGRIDKHKGDERLYSARRQNNVKEKRGVPRHYLGRTPPVAYHDTANSIVFAMINKVDECWKKNKTEKHSLRSFRSFSFARARARAETSSIWLLLLRLVGEVVDSVWGARVIPNGRPATVTRAFSFVRVLNREFARRNVHRSESHVHDCALR